MRTRKQRLVVVAIGLAAALLVLAGRHDSGGDETVVTASPDVSRAPPPPHRTAAVTSIATSTAPDEPSATPPAGPVAANSPMVGVCIVGGGRTFHITKDSIWGNVVEALQPDPRRRLVVLETTSTNTDCDANPANNSPEKREECYRQIGATNAGLDEFALTHPMAIHRDNQLTSCAHPLAAGHECCRKDNTSMLDPPEGLWGMAQYLRKHLCSQRLLDHEDATGTRFDFVVWLRPDLYFFEPLPPASYLQRALPRVLVSSKEWGTPIGDFIFLAPRPYVRPFHHALSDCVADGCGGRKGIDMRGIPELRLQTYLDANASIAYQTYPFLFAIVRDRHRADCMRLRNEVLFRAFVRDASDGSRVDPFTLCEEMFRKPPPPPRAQQPVFRSAAELPPPFASHEVSAEGATPLWMATGARTGAIRWRVGDLARPTGAGDSETPGGVPLLLRFSPKVRRLAVEVGARDSPETIHAWRGVRNMGFVWFEPYGPNAEAAAKVGGDLRGGPGQRLVVFHGIPILDAKGRFFVGAAALRRNESSEEEEGAGLDVVETFSAGGVDCSLVPYHHAAVGGCSGVLPMNVKGARDPLVANSAAGWKGCFAEPNASSRVVALRGADALALVPPGLELSMLRIRAQGAELAVLRSFGPAVLREVGVVVLKCQDLPHDSPLLLTRGGHTCAEIVACMRSHLSPAHALFDRHGNGPHERHCAVGNPDLREFWCIFRRPDRPFVDPQVDTDQAELQGGVRPGLQCGAW